jgi:hypothetical protein
MRSASQQRRFLSPQLFQKKSAKKRRRINQIKRNVVGKSRGTEARQRRRKAKVVAAFNVKRFVRRKERRKHFSPPRKWAINWPTFSSVRLCRSQARPALPLARSLSTLRIDSIVVREKAVTEARKEDTKRLKSFLFFLFNYITAKAFVYAYSDNKPRRKSFNWLFGPGELNLKSSPIQLL